MLVQIHHAPGHIGDAHGFHLVGLVVVLDKAYVSCSHTRETQVV